MKNKIKDFKEKQFSYFRIIRPHSLNDTNANSDRCQKHDCNNRESDGQRRLVDQTRKNGFFAVSALARNFLDCDSGTFVAAVFRFRSDAASFVFLDAFLVAFAPFRPI